MEDIEITKQVRQAEDLIIQLAKEKKKAFDAAASADRLVKAAEEQLKVLKSSSQSLESLSEKVATSTESSKNSIIQIYKDASKSLKESTARLEEFREDSKNKYAGVQSIEVMVTNLMSSSEKAMSAIRQNQLVMDNAMQSRLIEIQNRYQNIDKQIVEINESIKDTNQYLDRNMKFIILGLIAFAGAFIVAAVSLF